MKIFFLAKFPHIRLSVTEDNVLDALALITSIPFPENEETKPMALNKVFYSSAILFSSYKVKLILKKFCRKVVSLRPASR